MSQTLDQKRAAFVWQQLAPLKQRNPAVFDAYTKLSKGAGTLIMQNGLMPTLAFYGEKSKGSASLAGGQEHELLLAHLLAWLNQQQLLSTASFAPAMAALLTKTSPEYRAITEECLALIRWIRHFASALNKTE
ncbi:MAG TPA: type III-B CRISPR module-associated protein Cmr5 [Agitococcus sp.]|nr:type III-B CRISPR module-associated protein Cmr5 [Agitococcus sp.]HNC03753.1 type III-B CRISPR module-associated protein Cmr5 [Agitococcus sp.]HNH44986.1 type III-B CRISPR module-associated protein Cmr5 [Agitococcus sp.]